jgi:hypothetical protein
LSGLSVVVAVAYTCGGLRRLTSSCSLILPNPERMTIAQRSSDVWS